jgi:hypothetical protein
MSQQKAVGAIPFWETDANPRKFVSALKGVVKPQVSAIRVMHPRKRYRFPGLHGGSRDSDIRLPGIS